MGLYVAGGRIVHQFVAYGYDFAGCLRSRMEQ